MKRSEMVVYIQKLISSFEDCKLDIAVADEILEGLENLGMKPPSRPSQSGFTGHVSSISTNTWEPEDMDTKDIWLKKDNQIIGLHAVGYNEHDEFDVKELDGSLTHIITDFVEIEKWGNEYDKNFNMIGRGSFRLFDLTLEHSAQDFEANGWIRFSGPLKNENFSE